MYKHNTWLNVFIRKQLNIIQTVLFLLFNIEI